MDYKIIDSSGAQVMLRPRLELYSVRDFIGRELPGLAIILDDVTNENDICQYTDLTVSFGEFISIKNAAYIDSNNCGFIDQLLEQGLGIQTELKKCSGYCEYPLWLFSEERLREMGEEAYESYSREYDKYMASFG